MAFDQVEFNTRLYKYLAESSPRNGGSWPKDPLEKWILGWLQLKAEHGYRWSEWSVASEAAEAVRQYYR